MDSYRFLSSYYDRFTDDVGYIEWADFFEQIFERERVHPHLILDLACGTGSLSRELSIRGYDMIGVDASPEMLMQAMENTVDLESRPLFLNQTMEDLDLYGTVDACLCCLDSVNYVVDPKALRKAMRRVELFLNPGGIFIFDINTLSKFERMDGQCYVRDDDDVYCVWQVDFDGILCNYDFNIFERQGIHWNRNLESHQERYYDPQILINLLHELGFVDIKTYAELSFEPINGQEDRIFISARKRNINE